MKELRSLTMPYASLLMLNSCGLAPDQPCATGQDRETLDLALSKKSGRVGLRMINDDGAAVPSLMKLKETEPTVTYLGRCEVVQ